MTIPAASGVGGQEQDKFALTPERLKAMLACIWDESQQKFLYGPDAAILRRSAAEASDPHKEVT